MKNFKQVVVFVLGLVFGSVLIGCEHDEGAEEHHEEYYEWETYELTGLPAGATDAAMGGSSAHGKGELFEKHIQPLVKAVLVSKTKGDELEAEAALKEGLKFAFPYDYSIKGLGVESRRQTVWGLLVRGGVRIPE